MNIIKKGWCEKPPAIALRLVSGKDKSMIDQLIARVVDEGKWLTVSMGLALLAVAILFYRYRHSDVALRRRVLAAMNLFFGATIGTMAFGHLLAVTAKLATER